MAVETNLMNGFGGPLGGDKTNSLGVIYIQTKYDDPKEFDRVQKELDDTVRENYCVFRIDGDEIPDLAVCLNVGIKAAIQAGTDYITWTHPDFYYDDPNWYTTLRHILEAYPEIVKICTSNSRDNISQLRIGHEQSWVMRCSDFVKHDWLFFNEQFKGIGGYEDWYQHFSLLSRGFLVCITPTATIHHKGAQSRSKHDTTKDQWANHATYCRLTNSSSAVEPHVSEFFGINLTLHQKQNRLAEISSVLKTQLGL